jgi:hypothetical protein
VTVRDPTASGDYDSTVADDDELGGTDSDLPWRR